MFFLPHSGKNAWNGNKCEKNIGDDDELRCALLESNGRLTSNDTHDICGPTCPGSKYHMLPVIDEYWL